MISSFTLLVATASRASPETPSTFEPVVQFTTLKRPTDQPTLALYQAAHIAHEAGQDEQAATLLYLGLLRFEHDSRYFCLLRPDYAAYTNLFRTLEAQLSRKIVSRIMHHPEAFPILISTLDQWEPLIPAAYNPGWPYFRRDPAAAIAALTEARQRLHAALSTLQILANDEEYMRHLDMLQQLSPNVALAVGDDTPVNRILSSMALIEKRLGVQGVAANF